MENQQRISEVLPNTAPKPPNYSQGLLTAVESEVQAGKEMEISQEARAVTGIARARCWG